MPGKSKKPGGGNGGGGDGGGGGNGNGIIYGTPGDDVLRGGRGDDVFQSYGGTDVIYGRDGYDVLVVDGSVWDYEWREWSNWELHNWSNHADDVTLHDVEVIRFNDYEIVLGEEIPMEVLIAPPEELRVEAGGEASFTFSIRDMDDLIDVTILNEAEIAYGSAWLDPVDEQSIYGNNSQLRTYNLHYDYDRFYRDYTDGPVEELAEGEEYVLPITLRIKTSNFWLDADDPDRAEFHELTFDLVIVGENEAPQISGSGELEAVEDGGEMRFDLSAFGYDIDNDDDGGTLTYEIVSSIGGLDAFIDGTDLVLTASTLLDTATSDEFATGSVEIRAVDRHGAATSETATVDLTVRGVDDTAPPPDYLRPNGDIDFDAMDLGGAQIFDFGTQILNEWNADPATIIDLINFGEGDDVRVIEAGSLVNFAEEGGFSREGVPSDTSFNLAGGDDKFVFHGQSDGQSYLSFVDILGGAGEDVVAITLDDGVETAFHGGLIDTGAQSDRVLLHAEYGVKGWLTGDIATGSGHDFVDIRLTSEYAEAGLGEVLMASSINLGTGDDRLNLTVDSGLLTTLQHIDFSVGAGDGDDYVNIDLSGLGQAAVISEAQDPNGLFAELYPGGFEGGIHLGSGDDVLELSLSEAAGPVTAEIYADGSSDDTGYDVAILHHLTAGQATVETIGSYFGEGVRITDGDQMLDLYGFEQILLDDGTDLIA